MPTYHAHCSSPGGLYEGRLLSCSCGPLPPCSAHPQGPSLRLGRPWSNRDLATSHLAEVLPPAGILSANKTQVHTHLRKSLLVPSHPPIQSQTKASIHSPSERFRYHWNLNPKQFSFLSEEFCLYLLSRGGTTAM